MSSLNRTAARSPSLAAPYGVARNHNGLAVKVGSPEQTLTRLTLANMLWENQFYMDGKSTADLLKATVAKTDPTFVADLALRARSQFKLRHVPLLLARELARSGKLKADTLADVIQRPDELGEFVSMYWEGKKSPISNQVKKGLAKAFSKFNEYQLAKWDKNSAAVSLRDVMFLTHPKPADEAQKALFAKVANKTLETPDTWEVELSGGANKKETFTRLMAERKLGALAFIRNLRNMTEAGVSTRDIESYAQNISVERVLPFRFIAAARMVPQFSGMLEAMMFRCLEKHDKLAGKTVLLVDVSGSMFQAKISEKSDLLRFDAAAALAVLCREICEEVEVFSFSNTLVRIPQGMRGMKLVEALRDSQANAGTRTGEAVAKVNSSTNYDRCIIFTDEQSSSMIEAPRGNAKGYVMNVAAYQFGLNHDAWTSISGFSEALIDYVQAVEKSL